MFENQYIPIENASWWLPHSHVALRDLYLAEDEAAINNQANSIRLQQEGASGKALVNQAGSLVILKVQRMVHEGVVAVMLRGGRKHEVKLPADVHKLSPTDLQYLNEQIDLFSRPMSAEEQEAFLASANGRSEGHLSAVK